MKSIKLQTEILLKPEENQIDYSSKILLLGSCFSENIGERFEYYKFQNRINPFGIIFNPISLEKLIVRAIDSQNYTEEDVFEHNELWFCFETHSQLAAKSQEEILSRLNDSLQILREALLSGTHIILTHGTSWVYRHLESNTIVANCHKLPQRLFQKELLSIDDISLSLLNITEKILSVNPEANLINTISPVRHIKDGFVENTQSKAHLIAAIHGVVKRQSFYFPSYEIMLDELRDYRFYSEDMLHPNNTAIEIIWQKFSGVWIFPKAESIQKEIGQIQTALQHRPINPFSKENELFQEKLQQRVVLICQNFPHIRFS